jgi:hypothetical protein
MDRWSREYRRVLAEEAADGPQKEWRTNQEFRFSRTRTPKSLFAYFLPDDLAIRYVKLETVRINSLTSDRAQPPNPVHSLTEPIE